MGKSLLITRPNHDHLTAYLHDFSKGLVSRLKNDKTFHIANLEGEKATRTKFEEAITKDKPSLVFLNGHGDKISVRGYKDETLLDSRNVGSLSGKIVYALACDSLEELGELSIQKGVKAYIGYRASFMMVHDPSRLTNPVKDRNALPFRKGCTALIETLVAGMTVKECIKRTKEEYLHSIKSFGTSKDDPYGDTPLIRFALAWNHEFLDVCGDPEASFS